MTVVNPYLTFNGNCEEAFHFYKSVFGGEFPYIGRYKDMPPMEAEKGCPPSEENKIMHVSLPISKETVLMGSDSSDAFGHAKVAGNNFSISISTDTKKEADRMFKMLCEDGKMTMSMTDTFWGAYFGMCTDKFGIQWMVNVDQQETQKG
jgi:PhnB protein